MPDLIAVARAPDGALTYAVPVPPQNLPAVPARRLLDAWDAAREAAAGERWGPPRRFLFPGTDAAGIAIADPDAGCWAEAVDHVFGLDNLPGLAVCLRLLALVEVMGRAGWLAGLFDITPGGIELHPALLAAAATMPLDAAARFDEAGLRRLLSRRLPAGTTA